MEWSSQYRHRGADGTVTETCAVKRVDHASSNRCVSPEVRQTPHVQHPSRLEHHVIATLDDATPPG